MKQILLASASPRRRDLLKLLSLDFSSRAANVDEIPQRGETALELVTRLSRAKANAPTPASTLVIGADTAVEITVGPGYQSSQTNNKTGSHKILGKPRDVAEAIRMLKSLRGRSHLVHTGVTLLDPEVPHDSKSNLPDQTFCITTRVWMRKYSDSEIDSYVSSGDALDKAAAYGVQNTQFRPVASVEGCFANVMGLPLCRLYHALANHVEMPYPQIECHLHPEVNCTIEKLINLSTLAKDGQTPQLP